MHSGIRLSLLIATMAALLAGCGGGGGGGGGGATGSPSPDPVADVPQNAPPVPTPRYDGLRKSADLNDSSVPPLADAAIGAVGLPLAIANGLRTTFGPEAFAEREEEVGLVRGTAVFQTRAYGDFSGWVISDYDNFEDRNSFSDGRLVIEVFFEGETRVRRVSFVDYRFVRLGSDITYSGFLEKRGQDGNYQVSGSLAARVTGTSIGIFVENMAFQRETGSSGLPVAIGLSGTARVYEPRYGWIDLELETPWLFDDDLVIPRLGGPAMGRVPGGASMIIRTLARETAALSYRNEAGTTSTRTVRLAWDEVFERQLGETPVSPVEAIAGRNETVEVGTEVALRAGYSGAAEPRFVDADWELVLKPIGSGADVEPGPSALPVLVPDVPGEYLLRLTASDGQTSDTDLLIVEAVDDLDVDPDVSVRDGQFGPDEAFDNGVGLRLDGPYVVPVRLEEGAPQERVDALGLSIDIEIEADGTAPFDLEDGLFELDFSLGTGHADRKLVSVGRRLTHAKEVIISLPTLRGFRITTSDLDANGRADIVYYDADDGAAVVMLADGTGSFIEAGRWLVPGTWGIQLGDVTGDQRPDIVLQSREELRVIRQLEDGVFEGDVVPYSIPITVNRHGLADVDADGVSEIALLDDAMINILNVGADGNPVEAGQVPLEQDNPIALAADDIDGDGREDLVVAYAQAPPGRVASVTLAPLAPERRTLFLSTPENNPWDIVVEAADLDGDGDGEVVVAWGEFGADEVVRVFDVQSDSLVETHSFSVPGGSNRRLLIHDFDGDGLTDIGLHRDQVFGFTVSYKNADGGFGPPSRWRVDALTPEALADFDGDGILDLMSVDFEPGLVGIALGLAP